MRSKDNEQAKNARTLGLIKHKAVDKAQSIRRSSQRGQTLQFFLGQPTYLHDF